MLARDAERLATLASAAKSHLTAIACDATDPEAVANAFNQIEVDLGPLDCVIFNAGTFRPGGVLDTTPEDFEMCWRVGAFAGFVVGREAARHMAPRGSGSILFTGATASLRGSARFANLASPKFALRAIAQSMAREIRSAERRVGKECVSPGSIGWAPYH